MDILVLSGAVNLLNIVPLTIKPAESLIPVDELEIIHFGSIRSRRRRFVTSVLLIRNYPLWLDKKSEEEEVCNISSSALLAYLYDLIYIYNLTYIFFHNLTYI